jgi:hypothetical protein
MLLSGRNVGYGFHVPSPVVVCVGRWMYMVLCSNAGTSVWFRPRMRVACGLVGNTNMIERLCFEARHKGKRALIP